MSVAEIFDAVTAVGGVVTSAWAVITTMSHRRQAESDRQTMNTQFTINRMILSRLWEASEVHNESHHVWQQLIEKDVEDSIGMAAKARKQKQDFLSMTRAWTERTPEKWQEWLKSFSPGEMRELWKEIADDTRADLNSSQARFKESGRLLRELNQPTLEEKIQEIDRLFAESQQLLVTYEKSSTKKSR